MNLKTTIRSGIEATYDTVIDRIDTLFATAEVLLDEALPEPGEVSDSAKREVLARFCEDTGHPEHAEKLRLGIVPGVIVSVCYALVAVSNPQYVTDREPEPVEKESPKTPAEYLAYLKKHFPTMAKVYAQTLLEQERKNNANHVHETDENERYDGLS